MEDNFPDYDRMPVVAIIVPCYNEQEVLDKTNDILSKLLSLLKNEGEVALKSFILYVNDGSTDSTWEIIKSLAKGDKNIKGVRLAKNGGQQNALLAGLEYSVGKCDLSITIDADLQDDINAIPKMIAAFKEGADIVCGVRDNRETDSWFKRSSAQSFYKVMRRLGVDCVYNHADFRLLSRRAMADLLSYGERNIFIRGIIPRLGYTQEQVSYARSEREAGQMKYPFKKMMEFAIDGITSFSVKPVRMLFWLGLFFMLGSLAIAIYTLIRHFTGETVEGWTSLILSIWFCTGILLLGMGIMGEYIGKIYIEVKRRPRYKIAEKIG